MSSLEKLKNVALNKTLLYIESDKVLQKNFGIYLQKTFKYFYQSYDGEEGFELFLKVKPDIVVMDLDLSQKDSVELIVDMQEMNKDTIILTVSKSSDNYNLLQSLDMGLSGMLLKPITFAQLVDKLIRILPAAKKVVSSKIEKVKVVATPVEKKIVSMAPKKVQEKARKKPKEIVKETIKKEIKIPKTCMEDIQEYIKYKENVILVNTYKGITIQNKGELLNSTKNSFEIKTSISQVVAAKYEKHIVMKIEEKNKYIYAKVITIDLKNNRLQLVEPKYIDFQQRDINQLRLTADSSFKASIFFNKRHIDFKAKQISLNSLMLVTDTLNLDIKENMQIDLTFGFDIASPSVLIKERKFIKTFAKGTIVRINRKNRELEVAMVIDVQKSGQSSYSKYLKQRENEIIQELKKVIKR